MQLWQAFDQQDGTVEVFHQELDFESEFIFDVSDAAKEAGFCWSVGLTGRAMGFVYSIPPAYEGIQDPDGRLWDVLWMARLAVRRCDDGRELLYNVILPSDEGNLQTLKLAVTCGECGEPALLVSLPWERE